MKLMFDMTAGVLFNQCLPRTLEAKVLSFLEPLLGQSSELVCIHLDPGMMLHTSVHT
jgi:hypothetical protein